jgi:hypothetical protein
LLLAGAVGTSAQVADSPKRIRLAGSIVSITGEAVPKATLRLVDSSAPQNPKNGGADNDGKFVFEDVPPGRYTLS